MSPPRLLICTDLDRTLIPNGPQPEPPLARQYFSRLCMHDEVTLVYVSGRNKELVQKAIRSYQLPLPQLVITDVGTRIYALRGGDWQPDNRWEAEIAPDWAGMKHGDLLELFRDLEQLRLQKHAHQDAYKLSYNVSLHVDRDQLSRIMNQRLQQHGVRASLIWSVDDPAGIGLLDVTPASATKLHAVEFIRTGLGFTLEETVFAGDSGNDLPVLISPIHSVLVGNATREVRELALREAERCGTGDAIYCAGSNAYGNGNYSNGILDGILHFRPEFRAWIGADAGEHA